ncbi:acetyl/propionyl/methylcrotonyl-CoA carboxylase subunit alpha [Corynebacterium nasicanis]|uniref:biotin carboxylase n=1 Tax=Corynebacterium nasicanis TaxID=1448267 RepID=A0ABW1QEM2_9CORY
MFKKILIANRGEIAARITATCRELGVGSVAVHSAADSSSLHVRLADEAVNLGDGPSSENYLAQDKIIRAALDTGAEAIHPGYGFLAENAAFARAVAEAGLTFIGPSADAISAMGEKVTARELAIASQVPLAPGSDGAITSAEQIHAFGAEHGFPILVKASAGGGGRGMRRINSPADIDDALESAVREAESAFGNGEVYLERYLTNARHVEVQVFADSHGNAVYFGDRDCSVQRRHQKLIEEAPAPGLSDSLRRDMGEAAVRLAREVGYTGAGTVEFLVEGERFYFLEMNTRIQVEHPVTEMVQNIDLIAEQLRVAAGEPLSVTESGRPAQGVAIEARINAEDISGGRFIPTPGLITTIEAPTGEGLRFDAGYESGDEMQPYYDSLIGKLIAWGPDRDAAIARLREALDAMTVDGVRTTIPAAKLILDHPDFREVRFNTLWLESTVEFPEDVDDLDDTLARNEVEVSGRFYTIPFFHDVVPGAIPLAVGGAPAQPETGGTRNRNGGGRRKAKKKAFDGQITSPMQGTIIKATAEEGQNVSAGDVLFVLEAMKMENPITAPVDGTIGQVLATVGDSLAAGTLLTTLTAAEARS